MIKHDKTTTSTTFCCHFPCDFTSLLVRMTSRHLCQRARFKRRIPPVLICWPSSSWQMSGEHKALYPMPLELHDSTSKIKNCSIGLPSHLPTARCPTGLEHLPTFIVKLWHELVYQSSSPTDHIMG